jgi:hypothetical protein
MPLRRQPPAQVGKVVDLTIEDDAQLVACIRHGLVPGGGEIDDGKPPMPQTDATIR